MVQNQVEPKIGEDITNLMVEPQVGEDVTHLMEGGGITGFIKEHPSITKITGIGVTDKGQLGMRPTPVKELGESFLPESPQVSGKGIVGRALYENLLRPALSPLGLFQLGQGMELGIPENIPKLPQPPKLPQLPELPQIQKPTALQIPESKVGTPIFNTPQFGLNLSKENLPYPLNVVPNRLRPPSTNATVFDALLPERLKYNEQGAALPLTTEIQTGARGIEVEPRELHQIVNKSYPEGNAPPLNVIEDAHQSPPLPPRGGITKKDINTVQSYSGSIDQTLERRLETRPIVKLIRENANDPKMEFVGTEIRKLDDITKGMNKAQRVAFGKISEKIGSDEDVKLLSDIPNIEQKLNAYREQKNKIWDQVFKAREGDIGYVDDYVPHILKDEDSDFVNGVKDLFNYRQGKNAFQALFERKELGEVTGENIGIYGKGLGEISESPFTKERIGKLQDLDYNVNRIGRIYIESMGREIFDRPAVKQARELVKGIPDSKLKELSEEYIRNYTRYDVAPLLHKAFKQFTDFMVRTAGRTLLGFNPHLQELHAMRLGPVYAELGLRDFSNGLTRIIKNPIEAYQETASLGLLPQEIMPFKFQTVGEKADSILNFKSIIDFIDRSIAYNGFLEKFDRMGLPDAHQRALSEAKRVTFTTDPARGIPIFTQRGPAGDILRMTLQFKHVPMKIAEWMARTAIEAKQNPARAIRVSTIIGASAVSQATGGPGIFHWPRLLRQTVLGGGNVEEMGKIMQLIYKGDLNGALTEAELWFTPSGKSTERLLSQ